MLITPKDVLRTLEPGGTVKYAGMLQIYVHTDYVMLTCMSRSGVSDGFP